MINNLFWICNGGLATIAITSVYYGFWDVFVFTLAGVVTNIMVLSVYNSKK